MALLALTILSSAQALSAIPGCNSYQYETEQGICYPAWYGKTDSGAHYTIVIPEGWSAADGLVFWNHGFQSFLTGFEANDILSILNPLWEGYYTGNVEAKPSLGPYDQHILSKGYAMAASSYSQTGWAVFDSHISNGELYNEFLSIAGSLGQNEPEQFYIIGGSLGGIVSMRDLEEDLVPDPDGALLLCGAVAGSTNWIEAYDLRTIYEAVCDAVPGAELPKPWYERPELIFGELDYLESLQKCTGISSRLLINENNTLEKLAWELIHPDEADRLEKILGISNTENPYFLALNLWYAVFQLPRLINEESQLNGAIPFGNIGIDYKNESINQGALRNFALPSAIKSLRENYIPNGNIGNTKIVSIHTSNDGLVRVQNQQTLRTLIPSDQLTVAIVDDSKNPSHCGFSIDEGIAAWDKLSNWVNGGPQPSVSDLEQACLATASDEDSCNYDTSIEIGSSLPTFKRTDSIGVTGINTYNGSTGQLNFQSLKLLGNREIYNGFLKSPAPGSSLFTIGDVQITNFTSTWQHSSAFDKNSLLLYIPRVTLLNVTPEDSNEYDVYFRLVNEDEFDFIELKLKQ